MTLSLHSVLTKPLQHTSLSQVIKALVAQLPSVKHSVPHWSQSVRVEIRTAVRWPTVMHITHDHDCVYITRHTMVYSQ